MITIFLHIPKTGGTTLNSVFQKQFVSNELFDHDRFQNKIMTIEDLKEREKEQLKGVSGHYFYGVHEYFSKPCQYFTMLRDPIERVISSYYFLQTYPIYPQVRDMTLDEFVKQMPFAQNLQTKMVSGVRRNPNLQKALENLRAFKVTGITEQFDESLFLMKREFGWKNIFYTKKNVTKTRKSRSEIPPETIRLIKEYNKLDIKLYHFGKQLLAEMLNEFTEQEKQELDAFKKEQHKQIQKGQ